MMIVEIDVGGGEAERQLSMDDVCCVMPCLPRSRRPIMCVCVCALVCSRVRVGREWRSRGDVSCGLCAMGSVSVGTRAAARVLRPGGSSPPGAGSGTRRACESCVYRLGGHVTRQGCRAM